MNRNLWLMFVVTMLAIWNAGIIWFTQIAVYPLWPLVDAQHFDLYHVTWWHDMWPAFAPVGLMLLGSFALLKMRPRGVPLWAVWAGIGLQLIVHSLTIGFWAPIQATMATANGMSLAKYNELMATHWWRVGLFWAYAALAVWMFGRSLRAQIGKSQSA
jgi:hypothetical protein